MKFVLIFFFFQIKCTLVMICRVYLTYTTTLIIMIIMHYCDSIVASQKGEQKPET